MTMNADRFPLKREERVLFQLRSLYQSYGYRPYKMSKFEEYDLYVRNKDFLVSDGIITFTDTDGRLMALKPDVTLSIIKNTRDTDNLLTRSIIPKTSTVSPGAHVSSRRSCRLVWNASAMSTCTAFAK